MTFGRPAAIPDDYVKLALPVDYDNVLESMLPADPRKHTSVCFFNATMYVHTDGSMLFTD